MIAFFNKTLGKFHITPAIAWSMGGTLLSGLTGPVVALLIARHFSSDMQGYYYTFSSLLAMSVFLELGFNGCIVQFISHEYAHLGMENGRLRALSPRVLGRLASLTRLSLGWYMVAGVFLFIGVGLGGELFFRHNQTASIIDWRGPWWCLCALSAVNLMILPLGALLDGCDQVNWTARARAVQNIGRSLVLIGGLLAGLGLYAPAAATLCSLVIYLLQFNAKWRGLLSQILTVPITEKVSWRKEILPLQWRIAVSWASGYFIFSLFNPLLFSYGGAQLAGQFGMTWTILQAISGLSQSFVTTRGPRFGSLIAKGEWSDLRRLWRVAALQSLGFQFVGSAVLIGGLLVLKAMEHPIAQRMVGIGALVPLCIASVLNQVVGAVAAVARAEKREPFLWVSIWVAIIVAGASYLTVQNHAVLGVAYSYMAGALFSLVCAVFILNRTLMIGHKS